MYITPIYILTIVSYTARLNPLRRNTYFKSLRDSKEIVKLNILLSSAILTSRQDLVKVATHIVVIYWL